MARSREVGQYISALSNSAALEGRKNAYFVWGVDDKTHDVVGTNFDPNCDVKNEPLKHFLSRQLHPDVNFSKVIEKYDRSVYSFKENYIVVTIPFRWVNSVGWDLDQVGNDLANREIDVIDPIEKTRVETEKTRVKVLDLLRLNPSITTGELSEILGVSVKGIEWQLKKLHDEKLITRVGSRKNGRWQVLDKDGIPSKYHTE